MTTLGDPFLLLFGLHLVYVLLFFFGCVFISARSAMVAGLFASGRSAAQVWSQHYLKACQSYHLRRVSTSEPSIWMSQEITISGVLVRR